MNCANPKRRRISRPFRAESKPMNNMKISPSLRIFSSPEGHARRGSRFSFEKTCYIMGLRLMPYLPA